MTVICWFRRVLRLDDHPALLAAIATGQPVVPVVILDPAEAQARPASGLRQALSLAPLDRALRDKGSRLIVRHGTPEQALADLARDCDTRAIYATQGFPFADDAPLLAALREQGMTLHLSGSGDLVPRGTVLTQAGGVYQVFTPFWKALRQTAISPPQDAPKTIPAPEEWPDSKGTGWPTADAAMDRGATVVARHIDAGEDAAHARLADFLDGAVRDYKDRRDLPAAHDATSNLSDALAVGEISARRIWATAHSARDRIATGVEHFLSELAWREFARELMRSFPQMPRDCWREEWSRFPWQGDSDAADRWRRGQTGVAMVDAGMRELYATGRMHNRVRMIAASYLTKNLMTDWRVGLAWFEQTLTDWDPASNAMNWQWVAGCGPDASPYFRVFNPDTQGDKFDKAGTYRSYWLDTDAEGARAFADAAPVSWNIGDGARPDPELSLAQGRQRALDAYEQLKS